MSMWKLTFFFHIFQQLERLLQPQIRGRAWRRPQHQAEPVHAAAQVQPAGSVDGLQAEEGRRGGGGAWRGNIDAG